jgi:hypothetical protein
MPKLLRPQLFVMAAACLVLGAWLLVSPQRQRTEIIVPRLAAAAAEDVDPARALLQTQGEENGYRVAIVDQVQYSAPGASVESSRWTRVQLPLGPEPGDPGATHHMLLKDARFRLSNEGSDSEQRGSLSETIAGHKGRLPICFTATEIRFETKP